MRARRLDRDAICFLLVCCKMSSLERTGRPRGQHAAVIVRYCLWPVSGLLGSWMFERFRLSRKPQTHFVESQAVVPSAEGHSIPDTDVDQELSRRALGKLAQNNSLQLCSSHLFACSSHVCMHNSPYYGNHQDFKMGGATGLCSGP